MRATHSASDLTLALECLRAMGDGCPSPMEFGARGVRWLPRLAPSEITTLSLCDLSTGRRRVVSDPPHAFDRDALAAFDLHFFEHPLVRYHANTPRGGVHRISDSLDPHDFRSTALYADYYRKVGLDHALALPHALAVAKHATAENAIANAARDQANAIGTLTPREREVLGWVAAGKTNAQIAGILGTMPRTVAKHLERIYEKLGVETRTAAAMRAVAAKREAMG